VNLLCARSKLGTSALRPDLPGTRRCDEARLTARVSGPNSEPLRFAPVAAIYLWVSASDHTMARCGDATPTRWGPSAKPLSTFDVSQRIGGLFFSIVPRRRALALSRSGSPSDSWRSKLRGCRTACRLWSSPSARAEATRHSGSWFTPSTPGFQRAGTCPWRSPLGHTRRRRRTPCKKTGQTGHNEQVRSTHLHLPNWRGSDTDRGTPY
jgi:hypothetical protein